jgi:hypothetical protein
MNKEEVFGNIFVDIYGPRLGLCLTRITVMSAAWSNLRVAITLTYYQLYHHDLTL